MVRIIFRIFLSVLPGFVLYFSVNAGVFASDDFSIKSLTTYVVGENSITAVQHNISITNKLKEIFATQYAISVASTRIERVWAKDGIANLEPKLTKTGKESTISVDFIEKAVGEGKTLDFHLGYVDFDITQQIGSIKEMNIPKPENIEEYDDYQVHLIVPKEFSTPVQMIPEPNQIIPAEVNTKYVFNKDSLLERGITAIFGQNQVFSFNFHYMLSNPSPIRKSLEITLPPDTQYQKMIYDSINPLPKNIMVDNDGNWIAEYDVNANQNLEIFALGYTIIALKTDESIKNNSDNLNVYLNPQPAWQTEDKEIIELANELKTPENIYTFVVNNLHYDSTRINESPKRLGAKAALANKDQAICMEFTDLFVALSRAAGIPAREVNGYAYTQNPNLRPLSLRQDVLHAWPEYYDWKSSSWIPVDPTWGNTTQGIDYFSRFDLNHFAFVIHGESDTKPYPPGFYKSSTQSGKDVVVYPTSTNPEIRSKLVLDLDLSDEITAGLTTKGMISIQNHGNVALHNTKVNILAKGIDVISPSEYNLSLLLPYTELNIPITIRSNNLTGKQEASISIHSEKETYEKSLKIKPIISSLSNLAIFMVMGAGIAILTAKSRSLFLHFKKRFSSVRRKSK